MEAVESHYAPPGLPLVGLRWSGGQVIALVAWAAALNVGQALALRALNVNGLPGELPHFIRAVVVLAFYAAILAPVVVSARRQGLRFTDAVGLEIPRSWGLAFGLALMVVFVARLVAAAWLVFARAIGLRLPGGTVDITRIFGMSATGIAVTVFVAVVLGPFVEEVVFRGVAFAQLERTQGFAGAMLGSSVLFGLLHVNAAEFVPLVIAGALFAWLFQATRSLWTAVLAHALFNAVAVVAVYAIKALA